MSVKDFDITVSINRLLPEAQIELDNDGQIIIYTGEYQVEMAVDVDDYTSWENGELIQTALPYLTADEREVLISGMCGPCFDNVWGEE